MPFSPFLLLLFASLLSACTPARPETDSADVLAIRRGPFHQDLLLTGSLRAAHQDELTVPRLPSFRASIRWLATDGADVKAGDRVAELDNATFLTEMQEAQLAVSGATNALLRQQASAQAAIGEQEFAVERQRVALEKARLDADLPADLMSTRAHQEAQLAVRHAELEHDKAIANLTAARATAAGEEANLELDLDRAQRRFAAAESGLRTLQLKAGRDGLVLLGEQPWERRKLRVGDTVFVGWTLATLPDLSVMQVEAWLSDVDDGKVTVGMPASIVLDAQADQPYGARVAKIAAIASTIQNGSLRSAFRVVLDLDATDPQRMSPGMSVQVSVHLSDLADAVLVPRRAIDRSVSPPHLLLENGDRRAVELGPCNAMSCVLLSALPVSTVLLPTDRP